MNRREAFKLACDVSLRSIDTFPEHFDIADVQGAFFRDGETLIICFRWTDSKFDWMRNFRFWKKTIPYGNKKTPIRIHAGFLSAYHAVRKLIHDKVRETGCDWVVTIGHSFGAALATLCAVDMEHNFNFENVSCYAFGSPRVGNRAFAKSFKKRVPLMERVVYGDDIVCKVPPWWMFYKHVPGLQRIGKRGGIFARLFGVAADHDWGKYVRAL